MTPLLALALPLLIAATTVTPPSADPDTGAITTDSGVIYQTAHVGDETQGFLTISNSGSDPDTLTATSCPIADTTSLIGGDGKPLGNLTIPPKQTVTLSPKGAHLVLRSIHFSVVAQSAVPCTLSFSNAGDIQVFLYATVAP
jgi:copper(I)-binding protein